MENKVLSRVKVVTWPFIFSPKSWYGFGCVKGNMFIVKDTSGKKIINVDFSKLKKGSFNSLSGMWMFKTENNNKHYLHTSGVFFKTNKNKDEHENFTQFVAEMADKFNINFSFV